MANAIELRFESETGTIIDFLPETIEPLGVKELLLLENNNNVELPLKFSINNPIINGEIKSGKWSAKTPIFFAKKIGIYCLVKKGWLPIPFVRPKNFLVDRNIVIALKKIQCNKGSLDKEAFEWWIQFFDSEEVLFNPLPYAFECGFRKTPTFIEFKESYDSALVELKNAFPLAKIVSYNDAAYKAAYSHIRSYDQKSLSEINFLLQIAPIIAERKNNVDASDLLEEILKLAMELKLSKNSFTNMAVLSCLFEDNSGQSISIGRRIIKPSKKYSEEDAYNALMDLRHLELTAISQEIFKNYSFSLCTSDIGLTMFWSALAMRTEICKSGLITFQYTLEGLFDRLKSEQIINLKQRLLLKATYFY